MKNGSHTTTERPWKRIGIVAVGISPFALLCGGFLLLPTPQAQAIVKLFQSLGTVVTGLFFQPGWQSLLLFSWLALIYAYFCIIDLSVRRCSLSLALSAVVGALIIAGALAHQQQLLAGALPTSYFFED